MEANLCTLQEIFSSSAFDGGQQLPQPLPLPAALPGTCEQQDQQLKEDFTAIFHGFRHRLCHLLVVWPWTSCLSDFRFLIYKTGQQYLLWIWNVLQRLLCWIKSCSPACAAVGRRWNLRRGDMEWSKVIGGVPLKGTLGPRPFLLFASLMPSSEQCPSPHAPCQRAKGPWAETMSPNKPLFHFLRYSVKAI